MRISMKNVCMLCRAGKAVLIHCSDGWDRTSQVSSLAQVSASASRRERGRFEKGRFARERRERERERERERGGGGGGQRYDILRDGQRKTEYCI